MSNKSKKYVAAKERVEARPYVLEEALALVKDISFAGFDESVDLSMALGVNPRHADQMVRGTVVLPHGTGKTKRVVVIAGGEKVKEAEDAGADHAGGADLVKKIQEGWLDFEAVVATPDMMRDVGKLGKILGPRGMMPNAKTGTVTMNVAEAVQEIKAGKVEFRVDKTGIIHSSIGKRSFSVEQLTDNGRALLGAVLRAKPPAAKGKYMRNVHVATTMGPGVEIDVRSVESAA